MEVDRLGEEEVVEVVGGGEFGRRALRSLFPAKSKIRCQLPVAGATKKG